MAHELPRTAPEASIQLGAGRSAWTSSGNTSTSPYACFPRTRPLQSFLAVLTLSLGIGATTAMFSVVNGVLPSPIPFADPDRLVTIKNQIPKLRPTPFSVPAPDVLTYQRETKSFTDVAGYKENTYDQARPNSARCKAHA